MKAIFSNWMVPTKQKHNAKKIGAPGGFVDYESYLASWILSVEQAKKYFSSVELYCDTPTKEILDPLNLSIDKYHVIFDDHPILKKWENSDLWAASKMIAYSLQTEPYVHLDYDFYIFSDPREIFDKDVVVLYPEMGYNENNHPYYNIPWEVYLKACDNNPPHKVLNDFKSLNLNPDHLSYNFGIFGGTAVDAIAKAALDSIEVGDWSVNKEITHVKGVSYQVFIEQGVIPISLYLQGYKNPFYLRESSVKWTHLVGGQKANKDICNKMIKRLQINHPDKYCDLLEYIK